VYEGIRGLFQYAGLPIYRREYHTDFARWCDRCYAVIHCITGNQQRPPDRQSGVEYQFYGIIYWLTGMSCFWVDIWRLPGLAYVETQCGNCLKGAIINVE